MMDASNPHNGSDYDDGEDEDDEIDYAEVIEQNHLEIVTNLDLERQFIISYLRGKSVLDEEDCELIRNSGSTRQQRVSIFLDIIKRKGEQGMKHFVDALEFEYGGLYEKLTGKKAIHVSPPIPHYGNNNWNWTTGLAGKEYIDFDRVVLAKQLEQTVSDLHWITRSHHKVQEEKNILEKRYLEAGNKMYMQEQYINELKEVIEKTSEIKRLTEEENAGSDAYTQSQFLQLAMQHEMVQKTNLIIALQGKLLVQTEEIDQMRHEDQEYKESNDALKKEVFDLALMCDKERRHSKRLNEKVLTQHGEIQQVDRYKVRNRELKLKISCLTEAKEDLEKEVAEFRKYSEVLSAKYTMITEEKVKLKENREEICFSYQTAQDQINDLSIKLCSMKCENEYLQRNTERLQGDIITYREMQKTLHEERERLRTECEAAYESIEKANSDLMKTKRAHDESIHQQLIINRALDFNYRDVSEELEDLRLCLQQTKDELVRTKISLGVSRSSGSFTSLLEASQNPADKPKQNNDDTVNKQKKDGNKQELKETVENNNKTEKGNSIPEKSNTIPKRRKNKDLLDSIKRKISADETDTHLVDPKTSTYPKGLMTYEQLLMLYPPTDVTSNMTGWSKSLPGHNNRKWKADCLPSTLGVSSSTSSGESTSPITMSNVNPLMMQNYCNNTSSSATYQVKTTNLGYRRATSCDVEVTRKILVDVGKNPSEDSVFEYPNAQCFQSQSSLDAKRYSFQTSLPSSISHSNPISTNNSSKSSSKKSSKSSKKPSDDATRYFSEDIPSSFRKRSFLIDSKKYDRRRSCSAPVSPVSLVSPVYQL